MSTEPQVLQVLVANHRRFLEFLEQRTGSRADAEDLLQSAFVRALERGNSLRKGESAVAWFYRLLRNALVDRYRTDQTRGRVLGNLAQEAAGALGEEQDGLLRQEACRCVIDLLPALKPEYADMLRRVDVESAPVNQAAEALGITAGNAAVRLHRARKALFREVQRSCRTCADHGCLDCTCGEGPRAADERRV